MNEFDLLKELVAMQREHIEQLHKAIIALSTPIVWFPDGAKKPEYIMPARPAASGGFTTGDISDPQAGELHDV